MTSSEFTGDMVWKISQDPALYTMCPFLAPMAEPALRVHAQLKGKCTSCNRRPIMEATKKLGAAMGQLMLRESTQPAPGLSALREFINRTLNTAWDEIVLKFKRPDGTAGELHF